MTWSIDGVLAGLIAIANCVLLAGELHRCRRAGTLGPLLWQASRSSSVAGYCGLALGVLRVSDFLYTWHNSGAVEYESAMFGVMLLLVSRTSFLASRGLAVHEGGIDAGSLICRWSELRDWNWTEDRHAIRFWFTARLFRGPYSVRQEFDAELDALLNARGPMPRTESLSILGRS